jgi:hypothetical protein
MEKNTMLVPRPDVSPLTEKWREYVLFLACEGLDNEAQLIGCILVYLMTHTTGNVSDGKGHHKS